MATVIEMPPNDALERIAKKHGIRMLLRFGSTVTGPIHPRSDVDLAVSLGRSPSFAELAELTHELQELFPEREVDVALLDRADPLFLKKVTEVCELVFGQIRDLHALKIYAFKRYQDHRRFLEMERRFVAESLERFESR